MDSQYKYRLASGNGPSSSPSARASSRPYTTHKHNSGEPSTPDHIFSKSASHRTGSRRTTSRINTDFSRTSASPSSAMPSQPDTPQRTTDSTGSTPLVNPTSTLLQGLINEQRANRGSRRAASEHASDGNLQTPTAPSQEDSSSEKQRKVSNALSAGLKQPREMGMREMDQYVSKLNKLNFDLKLEIYHRSQQVISLEKKLERMEELEERVQRMDELEEELQELREVEENNQRLRESNEHLRLELDRRDQAVNEAVELICQLEAKIETLEPANDEDERPLTARPHTSEGLVASPGSTPKTRLILDVPDRTSSRRHTSSARSMRARTETPVASAKRPRRHPSFLRESSGSTSVLRSLYLTEENKSRNFSTTSRTASILSGDEPPEPESPRLSILSECSYLNQSITPSKQPDIDLPDVRPLPRSFTQPIAKLDFTTKEEDNEDMKLSRIDQWIQPHQDLFLPTGPKRPDYLRADRSAAETKKLPSLGTAFQAKRPVKPYKLDTPSMDGPIFNGGRLPPTPDTMSTSNTGARNGSSSSIIAEKSLIDQGRLFTSFSKNHPLRRPRSADDITTRPSTATTQLSGTIETLSDATQLGLHDARLTSMFPSFDNGAGSSSAAQFFRPDGSAARDYETPGKTGRPGTVGKDRVFSTRRKQSPPSLKSTHSELMHDGGSSPPLTPQDWLNAALPAEENHHEKQHKHTNKDPAVYEEARRASVISFEDEPQLPSPANLRVRIAGKTQDTEPPRRRLSLRPRFFSRTVTASQRQPPMSDPIDQDGAPSPIVGRRRRMSTSRRKSVNLDSSVASTAKSTTSGAESINSKADTAASSNTTSTKPYTSENTEPKRRPTSLGLFGWMRGATASSNTHSSQSNNNNTNNNRSSNPTTTRCTTPQISSSPQQPPKPIQIISPTYTVKVNSRTANRPSSALAFAEAHNGAVLDPAFASGPVPVPGIDEGGEGGRKVGGRFAQRRASRKV
ncbi:hypothetical protein FQN50_006683 [Emmonsiellopsis sp. PD_5]|nr:hypothetical protein FQN50_006683 [Emmonsiellopsis sp. PD_5]